jgi:hypothetical protein
VVTFPNNMIDKLFWLCVKFLHWLAARCGTPYEAVNVWVFCLIWPALTIALVLIVIVQWVMLEHP